MKSFKVYLSESQKTYDFRLRIAGETPTGLETKLKQCLEAYKLVGVKTVKRLPIQESPLFPNMGPVEINVVDLSLQYPCTEDQLIGLICEALACHQSCLRLTPANSPFESAMEGKEQSNLDGDVVLSKEDMTTIKPDKDLVGDSRIPNLIKELEETRRYEYTEAAGGKTAMGKTANDFSQDNISPVGSKQNKINKVK